MFPKWSFGKVNRPKEVAYVCLGVVGLGLILELVPLEMEQFSLKDSLYSRSKFSVEFSLPISGGHEHIHPNEPEVGMLEAVRSLSTAGTIISGDFLRR